MKGGREKASESVLPPEEEEEEEEEEGRDEVKVGVRQTSIGSGVESTGQISVIRRGGGSKGGREGGVG